VDGRTLPAVRCIWPEYANPELGEIRLLGIAFFFPGFVFSLPLTILCAGLIWTTDGKNYVAAVGVSFCVGVAAAIVCTIMLVRKYAIAEDSGKNH
jgi:hypothetical protein